MSLNCGKQETGSRSP